MKYEDWCVVLATCQRWQQQWLIKSLFSRWDRILTWQPDDIRHLVQNWELCCHVNVCKMLVLRPIILTLVGGIGTFDKLQEETRSLCERDRQCDPVEENKNCLALCFFLITSPSLTSRYKLNIAHQSLHMAVRPARRSNPFMPHYNIPAGLRILNPPSHFSYNIIVIRGLARSSATYFSHQW